MDTDSVRASAAPSPQTEASAADLERELQRQYGISMETLRAMYEEWSSKGVPKSVVEARYLRTRRFHGKLFSRLVKKYLGIETQTPHPLLQRVHELEAEVSRLQGLLEANGVPYERSFETDAAPEDHGTDSLI